MHPMNQHLEKIVEKRIEKVIAALRKNNMQGYFIKDAAALHQTLDTLIADGESVTVGGSVTLFETGTIDYLKGRNIRYLDRYAQGASREEVMQIFRDAFDADTYVTSTNALTEDGMLYNVDGNGNRVAAMIFGPKQVLVICGYNKICTDMDAAIDRVRKIAAPANTVRLNSGTPCTIKGECVDCRAVNRICCSYVTLGYQRVKDRIKVLILPDAYGF